MHMIEQLTATLKTCHTCQPAAECPGLKVGFSTVVFGYMHLTFFVGVCDVKPFTPEPPVTACVDSRP